MSQDGVRLKGITETVQFYFDGLYRSDLDSLRRAFHPAATICGFDGKGELMTMPLETFLGFVATVPSPEAEGVPYDMDIVSIDVHQTVASVKVHDVYLKRRFADYLHLIKVDNEWKIFGKVFHGDPV